MSRPRASVVIAAHQEAGTIEDTLRTLLADAAPGEWDVVVVCNGCTDDTARLARSVPGVRVVELDAASKVAALERGDTETDVFPRVYLDADVRLATTEARAMVESLRAPSVLLAGVRAHLDVQGATRLARWYAQFRHELPVFHHGVIGAGVYALDARGRARFTTWPRVLADDQFVFRLFRPEERATVTTGHTVVQPPATLPRVVRRGIRVARGNREVAWAGPDGRYLPAPRSGAWAALRHAVVRPVLWPGAVTWLVVQALVRLLARIPRVAGDWEAAR